MSAEATKSKLRSYGTFVVADPRTFEGDPFEVAGRAVDQAGALATLLEQAVEDAYVMARNAELERQAAGEMDVSLFESGPQGRKFQGIEDALRTSVRELKILRTAASFDPRKR
jgi:hypothetical protein